MEPTWAQRIADLEAKEWTLRAIADAIGMKLNALGEIKAGRTIEPRGMPAVKLYELHQRTCGVRPKRKAA
jgi:hypothetical protein